MIYSYRILKSSWGISIDIELDIFSYDNYHKDNIINVVENVYLLLEDKSLNSELLKIIKSAITDISDFIYSQNLSAVCIQIKSIDFNINDFQKEGLFCAIQDSIYKYYNKSPQIREIEFDKENNRYLFRNINLSC